MGTAYGKDIDIPIQAAVECEVRVLWIDGVIYTVIDFDYDQVFGFQSVRDVDSPGGVSAVVTSRSYRSASGSSDFSSSFA